MLLVSKKVLALVALHLQHETRSVELTVNFWRSSFKLYCLNLTMFGAIAIVFFRQDAKMVDVAMAFLHVASIQKQLQTSGNVDSCRNTHNLAQNGLKPFLKGLSNGGWVTQTYCFSGREQHGYVY